MQGYQSHNPLVFSHATKTILALQFQIQMERLSVTSVLNLFQDNLVLKEHVEKIHPREVYHCTILGQR